MKKTTLQWEQLVRDDRNKYTHRPEYDSRVLLTDDKQKNFVVAFYCSVENGFVPEGFELGANINCWIDFTPSRWADLNPAGRK